MGIKITTPEAGDFPRPVTVTLECDDGRMMFCRGFIQYIDPEGYKGCHTAAMREGWLERQAPSGRLWLCPECSGKGG